MPKIQKYDLCCILVISISILFWDSKSFFSNLRFLIITIPLFCFYYKNDLFYLLKNNWKIVFVPVFLIAAHYFFFLYYTDIETNYLSILKLIILFIISISVFLSLESFKQNFQFFINFSIILLSIFLIYDLSVNLINNNFLYALSINRFENCYHGFFTQMSYIFREESHFAMNIAPLLLTSIFLYLEGKNASYFILILTILIILFSFYFALSLTFIISMIFFSVLSIFFANKKKTRIIFLFLTIFLTTSLIFYPKCANKLINISSSIVSSFGIKFAEKVIIDLENQNQKKMTESPKTIKKIDGITTGLSSGVYINSIKISKNSFLDYPFGVGFDNYIFSFNSFIKKTSKESANLSEIINDLFILNTNDGSNNFAKISVEFGVLSIFFYIILIKFILSKQIESSMKMFIITALFTQIFIRGAGYFNGGFLILFFYAFYYQKSK